MHYYPLAGRLCHAKDGRLQIQCNAAGVAFFEAESDAKIADFGDFKPPGLRRLVPCLDYNTHVEERPLLLLQLTVFSCGGVGLGLAFNHTVADTFSLTQFVSIWACITRCGTPGVDLDLSYDRDLLRAHYPSVAPAIDHEEFKPPPQMMWGNSSDSNEKGKEIVVEMVKLARKQVDSIRQAANYGNSGPRYSRYEAIVGHVWRSTCIARGLRRDQPTKLHLWNDCRKRLRPPPPLWYIGNSALPVRLVAQSGDLVSNPVCHVASRVRKAIEKMNDKYLRSAINFLNSQKDLGPLRNGLTVYGAGNKFYRCPNLLLISLMGAPIYDADFGWGPPMHMGPAMEGSEGSGFILPGCERDGSVVMAIYLQAEHMRAFKKLVNQPTTMSSY